MKNRQLVLLIGCLLASCEDENPFRFNGSGTAEKDDQIWRAGLSTSKNHPYDIGIDLNFTVVNGEGLPRENLYVFRVHLNLERQPIYLTNSQTKTDSVGVFYGTLIDDGDVLSDVYRLDTISNNSYIQITKIDLENCEISGVFNITLKIHSANKHKPPPPEIIRFTDGWFRSKIMCEWLD